MQILAYFGSELPDRSCEIGIAEAADLALMRPEHCEPRSKGPAFQPVAVRNPIEPLDQIDVTIKDTAEVEWRHIETTFAGKPHCRQFDPAFGEAVSPLLKFRDPGFVADFCSSLRPGAAQR